MQKNDVEPTCCRTCGREADKTRNEKLGKGDNCCCTAYCSVDCQTLAWPVHKHFCRKESKLSKAEDHFADQCTNIHEPGNNVLLSNGDIKVRYLTIDERRELCQRLKLYSGSDEEAWEKVVREIHCTAKYPHWKPMSLWEYEGALKTRDDGEIKEEIQRQEERKFSFQHDRTIAISTVKEYCQHFFGVDSPEEAVWDHLGVPRLLATNEEASDKFERALEYWEMIGNVSDIHLSPSILLPGRRIVYDGNKFWREKQSKKAKTNDLH